MNGYQVPGYGWPGIQTGPQQQMMQQPGQAPQMTKPTVHADIIQIENEAAGENEPVDAGTSQMMITKDESTILIKSVLANGETTMDIYRKQPKAEKPAEPEYVTRAEFETRIAERIREAEKAKPALRIVKPEPAEETYETEPEYETEYETPAPRSVQRSRSTTGGKRR
jgi:3-hydroxy-3-methylglutaryl CoA synthase